MLSNDAASQQPKDKSQTDSKAKISSGAAPLNGHCDNATSIKNNNNRRKQIISCDEMSLAAFLTKKAVDERKKNAKEALSRRKKSADDDDAAAADDKRSSKFKQPLFLKSDLGSIVDKWLVAKEGNNNNNNDDNNDDNNNKTTMKKKNEEPADFFANVPHPLAGVGATYAMKGTKFNASSSAAQSALVKSLDLQKKRKSRSEVDAEDDVQFSSLLDANNNKIGNKKTPLVSVPVKGSQQQKQRQQQPTTTNFDDLDEDSRSVSMTAKKRK